MIRTSAAFEAPTPDRNYPIPVAIHVYNEDMQDKPFILPYPESELMIDAHQVALATYLKSIDFDTDCTIFGHPLFNSGDDEWAWIIDGYNDTVVLTGLDLLDLNAEK